MADLEHLDTQNEGDNAGQEQPQTSTATLQDHITPQKTETEIVELGPKDEATAAATPTEAQGEEGTEAVTGNKRKRAKKQSKAVVRGSTADYQRKEANRLAAERSRSRQSEKKTGLDEAFRRLSEDNSRLRTEIARLEQEGGSLQSNTQDQHQDHGEEDPTHEGLVEAVFQQQQQQQQQQEQDRTRGSSNVELGETAASGNGNGSGSGSAIHDALVAEAEAQAHSRTILAALMSDAEINEALGEDWMNHVDVNEIQPDLPASNTPVINEATQGLQAVTAETVPTTATENKDEGHGLTTSVTPTPHPASEIAVEQPNHNAMAVALHAEMEKHIRDDLAITKAAIGQIEKELAKAREGSTDESGNTTLPPYISPLPINFTSIDHATLTSLIMSIDLDTSQTSDSMISLKETILELRDSRLSEAERLQDLLSSLKVSEEDTSAIEKVLQPLKSHLAGLIISLSLEVCIFAQIMIMGYL